MASFTRIDTPAPTDATPDAPKFKRIDAPLKSDAPTGRKLTKEQAASGTRELFDPPAAEGSFKRLTSPPAAKQKETWFQPIKDTEDYVLGNVKQGVKMAINPDPVMVGNPAGKPSSSFEQGKIGTPTIRPGTPQPDNENPVLTQLQRPLGIAQLFPETLTFGAGTHTAVSKPLERATGGKIKADYTDLARMASPIGVAGAVGAATRLKKAVEGEKIAEAAVKVTTRRGDKLFTGPTHDDIHLVDKPSPKGKEGFITNKGRFVDRDEAAKIATKKSQVSKGTNTTSLHSHELKPDNMLQRGAKAIESIFSPTTMSKYAKTTEGIVRSARGNAERETLKAQEDINNISKEVNALPPVEQRKFVNYIETRSTGGTLSNPKLQKAADTIRGIYQRVRADLQGAPATQQMGFIQDYFVHQWKDPKKAQAFVQDWTAKSGSGKSLLKRSIPTIEDGIKAGLVPLHENPLDATMHYVSNMQNYLALKDIQGGMKMQGLRKFFPEGRQPPGWVALKGPGNRVLYTAADAKKTKGTYAGLNQAYAPEDAARIYNRYYGQGFEGRTGDLYRGLRTAVNAPTQLILGLSGYHYRLVANEVAASAFSEAFGKLAKGDLKGAGKSLSGAIPFYGAAKQAAKGRKIEKEYLGKNSGMNSHVVDILTNAGAKLSGIEKTLKSTASNNFWEAWKKGSLKAELASGVRGIKEAGFTGEGVAKTFGFAAKNIGKLLDTVAYPLFGKTIPYVKNAVNYDAVNDWIKTHPGASAAELSQAARDIVDSTDNRFGEMLQDNLFWDKKLKQALQLMVLSVGWDVGTVREMVGGTKDLGRLLGSDGELTPRAKYLIGAPIAHMLNASVYQYMKTGEGPQAPQDLVYPQTGGEVAESAGTSYAHKVPERLRLPSQENDVIGYQEDPLKELENKMAPVWKIAWNMANNEDWRGDPISYQYEQAAPHGIKAYAEAILRSLKPISETNIEKSKKGTAISPIEAIAGSTPTGMRQRDPEGYSKMQKAMQKKKEKAGFKRIEKDKANENPGN